MGNLKVSKLNQLVTGWRRGTVAAASYLKTLGISPELLYKYKQSRWITPIGRGAYALYGDTVEWTGALYTLQTQLSLNVHAGGKTALEMKGYAHYLSEKIHRVFLYGPTSQKLPVWFREYDWNVDIMFTTTNLFPEDCKAGFTEFRDREFSIRISSPERAAFEMLYHVPGKVTFEEAFLILENLISLRPVVVGKLLESCNNVKVKRLFMFMAEKHEHPWVAQVDLSSIDFGKGKRVIVKNGMLDKKYHITVPKETYEGVF